MLLGTLVSGFRLPRQTPLTKVIASLGLFQIQVGSDSKPYVLVTPSQKGKFT